MLGTKPGLWAKAASALNHQAIYSARGEGRGDGARISTDAFWSWTRWYTPIGPVTQKAAVRGSLELRVQNRVRLFLAESRTTCQLMRAILNHEAP